MLFVSWSLKSASLKVGNESSKMPVLSLEGDKQVGQTLCLSRYFGLEQLKPKKTLLKQQTFWNLKNISHKDILI